MVKMTGTYSIV